MFGAKARLQAYLNVIRPWAMGKDNSGWTREDFETLVQVDPSLPKTVEQAYVWKPIPDVEEYRLSPDHVIFPLIPYDITIDRLFLPAKVVAQVLSLNQRIASFNATLERLNAASERDVRWAFIVMLHAGLIGKFGGQGLHESFRQTEASLS